MTPQKIPASPQSEADKGEQAPNESQIEHKIERVLESVVSRKQLSQITQQITQIAVSEQFSGPIPHPKHIREYEQVSPGAADRLLRMAEKSLDHGIYMDTSMLAAARSDRKLGVCLGAGLFFCLIVAALSSVYLGSVVGAGLFLTAATVGGVGIFVRNGKDGKS